MRRLSRQGRRSRARGATHSSSTSCRPSSVSNTSTRSIMSSWLPMRCRVPRCPGEDCVGGEGGRDAAKAHLQQLDLSSKRNCARHRLVDELHSHGHSILYAPPAVDDREVAPAGVGAAGASSAISLLTGTERVRRPLTAQSAPQLRSTPQAAHRRRGSHKSVSGGRDASTPDSGRAAGPALPGARIHAPEAEAYPRSSPWRD